MKNTIDKQRGDSFAASDCWAAGDFCEAAHDITTGLFQSGVIVTEGAPLKVIGPSGNGLHPIAVCKADDEHFTFAVSASNLRRPNAELCRRETDGGLNAGKGNDGKP